MKNSVALHKLLLRKRQQDAPRRLLEELFPVQLAFVQDPRKRKAAFVLRRGGKSYALGVYLMWCALSYPSTKGLYMGLTKDSAENIMWLHIFEPLLSKLGIEHKYNKTKRMLQFPNRSTIQITGADASASQMSKYLGGKYVLAVFDECQDITHDLRHWIDDKLGPAMLDYMKTFPAAGTVCCAGTAGRAVGRYWYHITQPESSLSTYSVHRWGPDDNPVMAEILKEDIAKRMREEPGIEKTADFRNQMYCEWVTDNITRVYHNGENNILLDNDITASLWQRHPRWHFIIGCDFGWTDATAFVVCAFNDYDRAFYVVETIKKSQWLEDDLSKELSELRAKYKPRWIVGDCAQKQFIQTLRGPRHRHPIRDADKAGKESHIETMNSGFVMSYIKVIKGTNEELLTEWNALVWDEKKAAVGIYKELASKDNHAADACLYAHHFYAKWVREKPRPVEDPHPMMTAAENRAKKQLDDYMNPPCQDGMSVYDQLDRLIG